MPTSHRSTAKCFDALGSSVPAIRAHDDKRKWSEAMDRLIELRDGGTVGDVLRHLLEVRRPRVPEAVERRERELRAFVPEPDEDMPRPLKELDDLRAVPYQEIVALCRYLSGHSPFETKHGVKGAEFDNVLVVVGRGWNRYNFSQMLELAADLLRHSPRSDTMPSSAIGTSSTSPARGRRSASPSSSPNELSDAALQTVNDWFGPDTIQALDL